MSVIPTSAPKTPQLIPVALISLKLQDPISVLKNDAYSHAINLVNIKDGTISTVPNDLGLELEVSGIQGIDHITANTEVGVNRLDCKIYGKTPGGNGVYVHYYGLIKATPEIGAVLGNKAKVADFDDEYITSTPVILFADSVEDKYKWVLRESIIGKGRFIRDDTHLYVQYYLYVLKW